MTKTTAHIIAHSHWDREWYLPFEKHRLKLVRLMEDLIEAFDKDPDFTSFHLDGQYVVLEDYLEIMPHRAETVRRLVEEGRLILGPWYILQDEFLVSSEANARNLLIGILESKQMGSYAKVGYFPDSFGNMGQAPQIISQAGIEAAVFGRGVRPVGFNNEIQKDSTHTSKFSEMYWESPDGTRVLAILFANWYNNGMEIPVEPEEAARYWSQKLADARQFASTSELLFMNGCDHQPLQKNLIQALKTAASVQPDVEFRHSSFPQYIQALNEAKPDDLDIVRGELRSQWTDGWITLVNTASARVYIKQANVYCQTMLEKVAEPLAAMAYLGGAAYPRHELRYAWKTLLKNHPHDSICGCSVDEVHLEMMTRFAKAGQVAETVAEESAQLLASQVNTSAFGEGSLPFVVYNTTGHARSGVIRVVLDVDREYFQAGKSPVEAYEELGSFEPGEWIVRDALGNDVLAEVRPLGRAFGYDLPEDRFRQPYWAYQLEVELYVKDVPGIGYQSFALVPAKDIAITEDHGKTSMITGTNEMENEFVRIRIGLDGSFAMDDKVNGCSYEGLGIYEDTGDIGNEYMYKQPDGEEALTTRNLPAKITVAENTPLRAVFRIEHSWMIPVQADDTLDQEIRSMTPFRVRKAQRVQELTEVKLRTELTLEKSARSVGIRCTIDNTAEDHRVRMLFPTGLDADYVTVDSIYELAQRPIQPEPAWTNPSNAQHQNGFVSLSGKNGGITIANKGLNEYEALEDGTLAVTLLRGVRELGDWGVFMTPEAQCKGQHTLEMLLISHDPDIIDSGAFVEAYQFPVPWTAVQTGVHDGSCPPAHAMLEWQGERLALSAIKAGEETEDLFVRVFNVSQEPSNICLAPAFEHSGVYNSTLLEADGPSLTGNTDSGYVQQIGSAKIETFGFRLPQRG